MTLAPDRPAILGSTEPRLWTPPLRPLTPQTSLGWQAIEFARDVLGIRLLPWQQWLLIHLLELRPDGAFRFRKAVILIARQNGKTTLSIVLALWRLYIDRARLVIGTAQNLDVSEEAWGAAVELAESVPDLSDEIEHVDRTNGKKALRLASGARYKLAAASRRGGRGLSGDLVLLDELREHQTWAAWSAVTKTTNARPRAQVVATTNAGDATSIVLNHLREQALLTLDGGGDPALGIFEWSPDVDEDDKRTPAELAELDRDELIRRLVAANPSLGYTIQLDTLLSDARTDPPDVFSVEVLCLRVDHLGDRPIPAARWAACLDAGSTMLGSPAIALDIPPDRSTTAIAACGVRDDRLPHVELIDYRPGTAWVVDRVAELAERWQPVAVVLDPRSPAGSLLPQLDREGVRVTSVSSAQLGAACGALYDDVVQGGIRHTGQAQLDAAVSGARRRRLGGAWAWRPAAYDEDDATAVDISPLVAVTLARWALLESGDLDYEIEESIY